MARPTSQCQTLNFFLLIFFLLLSNSRLCYVFLRFFFIIIIFKNTLNPEKPKMENHQQGGFNLSQKVKKKKTTCDVSRLFIYFFFLGKYNVCTVQSNCWVSLYVFIFWLFFENKKIHQTVIHANIKCFICFLNGEIINFSTSIDMAFP